MDSRLNHIIDRVTALCPATNRIGRPDLEDLIKAIEPLLLERPHPDQLWTGFRLAAYLGLEMGVVDRLMKAPDAPKPFRTTDTHMRVWRSGDVFDWLDRREKPQIRLIKTG